MPHSEIHGSKGARPSPRLFAACHVLHRLSVPRHPPNALTRLIRCASAAHREQTPRMQPQRLDLYSALHCYPPGRCPGSLRLELKSPRPGNPCQRPVAFLSTMSKIQKAEVAGQRTDVLARAISPNSCLSLGQTGRLRSSPRLMPAALVEPTGIEPVTPCLQSRCSPS